MSDAARFITGAGVYIDDLPGAGHLHMAVLRAPVAHAERLALDLGPARAMAGVALVLGPEDLAREGVGPLACRAPVPGMAEPPRPVLATGKIAYQGQPLAAVIAESASRAQDAVEAIGLRFLQIAPVLDPLGATAAPPIWADAPGNRAFTWEKGNDTGDAFARAARVVRLTVHHPRTAMAPVEPRGCVARFAAGRYHLATPSQGVHSIRAAMAAALGVGLADIRVTTPDVGGSFAVKIFPYPEHVLALVAARLTGRTVRWVASRSESMAADAIGRGRVDEGELALDADGGFLGFRIRAVADMGAFLNAVAPYVVTGGAVRPFGQTYDIPAMHYAVEAVYTNQPPTDAYRGAGKPESALTLERLIDRAAVEMGLDRFEIRRRNLIRPGAIPYATPMGETYDAGDFPGLAGDLHRASDWAGFADRRAASAARGLRRGIAVTFPLHATGGSRAERARLRVLPGGDVELRIGVQDNGQAHRQALALIVAEALQIDPARIVLRTGDSDLLLEAGSTGGSSMLAISGNTAHAGALALIETLRPRAADHLEAALADIDYGGGAFTVTGTDRRVTLAELAEGDDPDAPACAAETGFEGVHTTFPNGGFVAEVEVDPETGQVRLDRMTAIADLGRVIQKGPAIGQIQGGLAQGLGEALMEALVSDADGQLLTGSWMDYAMPRADDLCVLSVSFRPTDSPNSALGTKGVGELSSIGATGLFVNAVLDAIGAAHLDRPLTAPKLWSALHARMDG